LEGATSQRMELLAALEGLVALRRPSVVELHSDSAYLINCFQQWWYLNWYRKGWMSSGGSPVANRDLWERLLFENERHEIEWVKVEGHAGLRYNEMCDRLAERARLEGYGYVREELGRLASVVSNESITSREG